MTTETLLRHALQAIRIDSPTSFSWFDKPGPRLVPRLARVLTPAEAQGYLLHALSSTLYGDFYLRGKPTPGERGGRRPWALDRTAFQAELSAANAGIGYWDEGWRVQSVSTDIAIVLRDGFQVTAGVHDCKAPQGGVIEPGATVRVRFPNELLRMSPGFYVAVGDQPLRAAPDETVVRLYWNLTADGAVPFVRVTTRSLNEVGAAFRLKVLSDPELFSRCDAAVIYVLQDDYRRLAGDLETMYSKVREYLKPDTPVFTKRLADGVGMAEDPGGDDSFGMSRCRLVAESVIRAHERGRTAPSDKIESVRECFEREGIRLEVPFLNRGSVDIYSSFLGSDERARATCRQTADVEALLETAGEIGLRLTREAFWHADQCTWLSPEPDLGENGRNKIGETHRTLGPDLYSGTCGIALFLAELSAATRSAPVRRTALGAIRHATAQAGGTTLKDRLGLYTGALGVALAAARVGMLLSEEEPVTRARELLHQSLGDRTDTPEFDLLSGIAGAIVALLTLRMILPGEPVIEIAGQLGDELLERADSSGAGSSWRSIAMPNRRNLTGMSHGAAGVAYALLELFRATGDNRYRSGAESAFEYERFCYVAAKRNWPDFREFAGRSRRATQTACSTFWCHGAPGIALSRLRAFDVLGSAIYRDEALIALETTGEMVEESLRTGNENFSLCHGLAGNAEVLLCGERLLDRASGLALDTATMGIEKSKRQAGRWFCGAGPVETQGLLLGLAGIGYFYLRLRNPALPSILFLPPEEFAPSTAISAGPTSVTGDLSPDGSRPA